MYRLLFAFLLLFSVSQAQESYTLGPKAAEYYKYKVRTPVMHEDFNDDSKSWIGPEVPADANVKIADGMFQLDRTQYHWYIDIPFHDVKDFEIEFVAKIDEEKPLHHYGSISFGDSTCGLHGFHFVFANFGLVKMYGCQFGECEKKKTKHYVNSKKRSFNKYSVRKISHDYYVFVNDIYEFTQPFMPLRGNRFVITTNPNSRVLFDYIKISYLN